MAVSVKVGSFVGAGSTGNQAITGVGFQPDVVIFFGNRRAGAILQNNQYHWIGAAASSTARWAHATSSANAADTTDTQLAFQSDACILTLGATADGVITGEADFVSMDTDGFTVNWSNVDTAGQVNYIAIGGISAAVGFLDLNTSTGDQSVGSLGFAPTGVFFCGGSLNTTEGLQQDGSAFHGAADGTDEWCFAAGDEDALGTTDTYRFSSDSSCIAITDSAFDAIDGEASFSSLDAGGFTINIGNAPGSSCRVGYLALGGDCGVQVGTDVCKTGATGTVAYTTGNTPVGVVIAHCTDGGSFARIDGNDIISFGASDGVTDESISDTSKYNVGTSVCKGAQQGVIYDSREGNGNVLAQADMDSLDANGFTLDWTDTDTTARNFGWMALSDEGGASGTILPHMMHLAA